MICCPKVVPFLPQIDFGPHAQDEIQPKPCSSGVCWTIAHIASALVAGSGASDHSSAETALGNMARKIPTANRTEIFTRLDFTL